jgi:hypothetical protein
LFILAVGLFLHDPCKAQSYAEVLDSQSIDWHTLEGSPAPDSVGIAFRDSLRTNESMWRGRPSSGFHFVDVNADGRLDLISNSQVSESKDVTIWIKSGNTYVQAFTGFGNVTSFHRAAPWLPLSFRLYNYACCDGELDFIEDYVAVEDGKGLRYQLASRVMLPSYHTENVIRFYSTPTLIVLRTPCVLRLLPIVDDERRVECGGCTADFGNHMATYRIGAHGFVLGTITDSVGDVWDYVIMNADAPHTFAPYIDFEHGDNSKAPGPVIGWIRYQDLMQ